MDAGRNSCDKSPNQVNPEIEKIKVQTPREGVEGFSPDERACEMANRGRSAAQPWNTRPAAQAFRREAGHAQILSSESEFTEFKNFQNLLALELLIFEFLKQDT